MQRVVPDVGHGGNVVDGHPQDDVFSISPNQLDVVGRQTHHRILLWCQLACQLMALLKIKESQRGWIRQFHTNCNYYISFNSQPKILTLAVSMSCSISVRLDGFKYPGTDVSCPKYCRRKNIHHFKKRHRVKSRINIIQRSWTQFIPSWNLLWLPSQCSHWAGCQGQYGDRAERERRCGELDALWFSPGPFCLSPSHLSKRLAWTETQYQAGEWRQRAEHFTLMQKNIVVKQP